MGPPPSARRVSLGSPRRAARGGGRGVEGFPPQADVPFDDAVVRQLAGLDRGVAPSRIKDLIAGRREADVRRAVLATRRARPQDVLAFFAARLGPAVRRETIAESAAVTPLRRVEDPYAP